MALLFGIAAIAQAQWQMEKSGTNASLRGIHAVNDQIAWASGTGGTVLRTLDAGQHWQPCAVPPNAAKLDFRAVWAWDAQHAMVMSSGPGRDSRLYSTHDGCRTWRVVFQNPDASGFWDALQFDGTRSGMILGDPVDGSFVLYSTSDGGNTWTRLVDPCLKTMQPNQGAFAASNQSLVFYPVDDTTHRIWFGTSGGWLYSFNFSPLRLIDASRAECVHLRPLAALDGPSAGIFALGLRDAQDAVAVGGEYKKPKDAAGSAAYTTDGQTWRPAERLPAGYRSTVAWNRNEEEWITAGPSGSDISKDDGKTWQPFDSTASWNALSLPFAVGESGRIGRLVSWGQLRAINAKAVHARP